MISIHDRCFIPSYLFVKFRNEVDSDGQTEDYTDLVIWEGSQVFKLRWPWYIIVVPMNILISGSGTMLSSFTYFHIRKSSKKCVHCPTFLDGVLQLVLALIIFGWIWSILFGLAIYRRSSRAIITGF